MPKYDKRGRRLFFRPCPHCNKQRWCQTAGNSRGCRGCSNRRRFQAKYGWIVPNKTLRLRWLNKWHQILKRCSREDHPSYHNYGGRGIRVHPQFKTFAGFMRHVKTLRGWSILEARKRKRCLDRIDNNKGYRPGNLRITTYRVNRLNQRRFAL